MMRSIFNLLISPLFVLLVLVPDAFPALNDFDRAEFANDNALAKFNPGFESGVTQWTASGGTLASNDNVTQLVPNSKQYGTWDSNSAGQTLQTAAVTVAKTGNCEFAIWIAVPSGTATHTITVTDGSNDLVTAQTIVNNTNAFQNFVSFPCPASGTVRGKLTSVNSNEPSISIDNARLGSSTRLRDVNINTERKAWTPTGVWVSNATYTGFESRVGDTQHVWFRITLGGAPSGTLTMNIPSGCTIDTTKTTGNNARNPIGNLLIFDSDTGANIYGTVQAATTTSVALNVILTGNASTTPISNITATVPITFASGDTIDGYFSVPCVGFSARTALDVAEQGWYVDANLTGGNFSLGVADVTAYAEMSNASMTLTPRSGSAAAGVMCSSTNAATSPTTSATTCAAGSESFGLNFVIPRSGAYEVCGYFNHFAQVDQAESLNSIFQWVETPTNAQTNTTLGGTTTLSGVTALTIATGTTQAATSPHSNCAVFNWSAGTKGVRLMYEQSVVGTPNNSLVLADEAATVGQRNIRVTVKPWTGQQQTVLANSVSSNLANGLKIEAASIDNSGSATVIRQTGSWVSSVSRTSAGVVEINYAATNWSVAPICTITINAANLLTRIDSITTTRATVRTITEAGVGTDNPFYITCIGPR